MDSFELTKVAGAVLAALLTIFGAKTFVELNTGHKAEKPGYSLAASEPAEADKAAEAAPAAEAGKDAQAAAPADAAPAPAAEGGAGDIVALLAKANADNGKAAFAKCKGCHVVEKGKKSTVGPNLYGVVNRKKASAEGFTYSEAMKAKGGEWTFENLAAFIKNPKGYVPGTKMVFNGLGDPAVEADVIAYLATLADAPVPLPK